jgi:hypothetical protein
MLLLTEKEIKMLGETILEAIDTKVSPIIEKIERIEKPDQVSQADLENFRASLKADFQAVGSDITNTIQALTTLKDDIGKKFHVAAKTIGSIMLVLRKQSGANICDKDIKGLALLMGEQMPETEGLNKDQLNRNFRCFT